MPVAGLSPNLIEIDTCRWKSVRMERTQPFRLGFLCQKDSVFISIRTLYRQVR